MSSLFEDLRKERNPGPPKDNPATSRTSVLGNAFQGLGDSDPEEDWLARFPKKAAITFVNDLSSGLGNLSSPLPQPVGSAGYLAGNQLSQGPQQSSAAMRAPLRGGVRSAANALALLNAWFVILVGRGGTRIAQINSDGTLSYLSQADFSVLVRNISVSLIDNKGATTFVRAEKFWLEHPDRNQRTPIFDPAEKPGAATEGTYNLWHGFAVPPQRGWAKQRRLLRHIHIILCKRDRAKFKYLMRWLAWAIQNPHLPAGTVIVLKSRSQGTGKSTLSYVMRDLFGRHARVFDNKERLLGRFNADLETVCMACAEEMVWAGDRSAADALKSFITGDTITIEFKNGPRWDVSNRIHMIMTTNHDHAVQAGVSDRRFLVLEVSQEKEQDARWFGPLYQDLGDGGREQFLWLLQNLNLKNWHPRNLPKTEESKAQQRMSADSMARWLQSCIEADALVGGPSPISLNATITSEDLRKAYAGYCNQHKAFPVSENVFGRQLTAMFGAPTRMTISGSMQRPRAYNIPDSVAMEAALNKYLGL